jgi:hypothetical protein
MIEKESATAALPYLNDFQIFNLVIIDIETEQCPHLLYAITACRARIHAKHIELAVEGDFENMGMSANEKARRIGKDFGLDIGGIPARIAADMGEPHRNALTHKTVVQGIALAEGSPVDVARYGTESLESLKLVGYLIGPQVARMPNLVTRVKIFIILVVPVSMGI